MELLATPEQLSLKRIEISRRCRSEHRLVAGPVVDQGEGWRERFQERRHRRLEPVCDRLADLRIGRTYHAAPEQMCRLRVIERGADRRGVGLETRLGSFFEDGRILRSAILQMEDAAVARTCRVEG